MEKTYAYKNTEDILKKSSSGGAFWGIAETFFDNGGYLLWSKIQFKLSSYTFPVTFFNRM